MFAPISFKSQLHVLNPIILITKLASNPWVPFKALMPLIPMAALALVIIFAGEMALKKTETLRL
jgi:hypothetical protein